MTYARPDDAPTESPPFDDVYTSHHRKVFIYAFRRLPSPESAEDVTADVFCAAWIHWCDGGLVTLPWLYRVAANKIADDYRRSGRRTELEQSLMRSVSDDHGHGRMDPLDSLALREALLTLSERERAMIRLSYLEDLPARDVAEALGCTRETVWGDAQPGTPPDPRGDVGRSRRSEGRARRPDLMLSSICCSNPRAVQSCLPGS